MKKSDNNYLSPIYKETKMMVKVTVGYRQQSLIKRLFYDQRHPKENYRSFPDICGLWQRFV